jgi:hypothetical protein
MKNVILFFACLSTKIKKNFFNEKHVMTNSNCNESYRRLTDKETIPTDEYLSNYKTTTRWQTL